ncbi:MAG: Na+/H+ antiporter subunit E [Thiotrichales bacterium]|nr:MAG: Na+/H+ antiporter subunit E [Thiotrichales bacterium]
MLASGHDKKIMGHPLKHLINLGVLLFALWLGLSGQLDPLLLTLGLISICLILYLSHRMDTIDQEIYPARLTILLIRFWLFLAREIVVANIDVIKRIFRPGKNNISPQLFELPLTQRTDLARVIYANAITMTPGTVSVNLDSRTITVHTLSIEAADELRGNRMANAVPEEDQEK